MCYVLAERFSCKSGDRHLSFIVDATVLFAYTIFYKPVVEFLTLILLNPDLSFFENTVDPDQLSVDEIL